MYPKGLWKVETKGCVFDKRWWLEEESPGSPRTRPSNIDRPCSSSLKEGMGPGEDGGNGGFSLGPDAFELLYDI